MIDGKSGNSKEKNNKCQFCRGDILEDAEICCHCGREQLSEDEQLKLLFFKNLLSKSLLYAFVIILFGFAIHIATGIVFILGYIAFVTAYSYKKYKKKKFNLLELQKQNKKDRLTFSIFGIIILALCMTTPGEKDFQEYIRNEYRNTKIDITKEKSKDFGFFSIYAVDFYHSDESEQKRNFYLGVMNRIYKVDEENVGDSDRNF